MLEEEFRVNPKAIHLALPGVASTLGKLLKDGPLPKKSTSLFRLTPQESDQLLQDLSRVTDEALHSSGKALDRDQRASLAVKGLGYVGALTTGPLGTWSRIRREDVKRLAELAIGARLKMRGQERKVEFAEGVPASEATILPGIVVTLDWENRAVSLKVDPRGWAAGNAAARLVGIGDPSRKLLATRSQAIHLNSLPRGEGESVLVDTSALLAIVLPSHEKHDDISLTFLGLLDRGTEFYTTPYICAKVHLLLMNSLPRPVCMAILRLIHESMSVIWIDSRIHLEALQELGADEGKVIDLTDWTTILLSRKTNTPILGATDTFQRSGIDLIW